MPLGTRDVSLGRLGLPVGLSGMFFKGSKGGITYMARTFFPHLFVVPFSSTLLETILEPVDTILFRFGSNFNFIVGALGCLKNG